MAQLLKVQIDLFERLQKAVRNFKKTPKERLKQPYIETRLQSLEELYSEFREGHRNVISTITEELKAEHDYFKKDYYELFSEEYTTYKTTLKEHIPQVSKDALPKQTSHNAEVKLPRIQLPNFTGKYDEWQTFHDMFISLIHNNDKLTNVQKLHYLKTSLTGEPENLLKNLSTTEQNYTEAWKQLTKRYNNKRYNCNAVMKTLFSQKQIQGDCPKAIKQLLDTTSSCLKALNNLSIDTRSWSPIIVYLVVLKLDVESHKQWENLLSVTVEDLPTFDQLTDFLESRFRSLEMIEAGKQISKTTTQTNITSKPKRTFHAAITQDQQTDWLCTLCGDGQHSLYLCRKFGQQSAKDRQSFVQSKGLCFNCLSPTHIVSNCRIPSNCKICGRRHHTMLHVTKDVKIEKSSGEYSNQTEGHQPVKFKGGEEKIVTHFSNGGQLHSYNVLLATAVVKAKARDGRKYMLRALLDQGSQASFVTESTVQLLGLKRVSANGVVSGLGEGQTRIKHTVTLFIESRHNPQNIYQVNAFVLTSLTSLLPSSKLNPPTWLNIKELPLADTDFSSPRKVDILLGAEVYSSVLLEGILKKDNLVAQNTTLGWIFSGKLDSNLRQSNITAMHVHINEDDLLKRFWEIEAEPNNIQKRFTKDEQKCEVLYEETTTRNSEGRYIVRLPFMDGDPQCQSGRSKDIAARKLISLEKRLVQDPYLYNEYKKVMDEYVTLNHMARVDNDDTENPKAVYLPHHAVVREDKETTKVRVVFNASSKGVNNVSLNDNLLVGPKIQQDLRHLLMRWRLHQICIVGDLVKMYRQVLVHESDTNFQRILWRPHPQMPIEHYKLLTLTFGTACAPYLAVKTLQRLADDEGSKYPVAAKITKRDFYVDDLMTGCDTETEAKRIYDEMNKLMNSGGFQVQKWSSNNQNLLNYINTDKRNSEKHVPIKLDNTLKVLGICWSPGSDNFEYTVNLPEIKEPVTKRQVLSDIASIYDPLGWIGPIVITAKVLIQKMWKSQLNWDDTLTGDLLHEWLNYRYELTQVKNIIIPRWLHYTNKCDVELHAFSDASQTAYAAAVYLRVIDDKGVVHTGLVSAKTKVTPIEKQVSIPRLELCGATLAVKLITEVSQVMNVKKEKLFAWTDSTVVLAWLKGGASRWQTFVSNRVSEILTSLDYEQWGHVTSEQNPSDCASRGLKPAELQVHYLWWHGPNWLKKSYVKRVTNEVNTHEEEKVIVLKVTEPKNEENLMWTKYSDLKRMLRIMSYCRRFLNYRIRTTETLPKFITAEEMNKSLIICIKQIQELMFYEDLKLLLRGENIPKKSMLHTLCPILDKNGIIRVGGRINLAHTNQNTTNPIIIPKSHLSKLLIADSHIRTLHGGPQVMLNLLRAKYWIIRARDQVKTHYRKCVVCQRYSKTARTQLMGQIPEVRLTPNKPFRSTGVDYAGPIHIRFSPGRGAKSYKGYICLFVCMVTRAIHIEVVSDLTSQAFIAAFRRFTSRRGHCQDIYSDNGTNFVGADKELRDMFDRARSSLPDEIAQVLSLQFTNWHFIPPYSPNFGGLWESGIRCAKSHLKRVIGNSTLTFEELSTVLSQVEACLNSRPITVISDDAFDPLPLTPGHFLIGEPVLNVYDDNYSHQNIALPERWKLIQKMVNDFWKRWSKEYLVALNQRYKWNTKKPEPEIDDIVILKDENLPPAQWMLGKIVKKHTGPDNLTRVVTIKCKNGLFKRPLSKVCVLEK